MRDAPSSLNISWWQWDTSPPWRPTPANAHLTKIESVKRRNWPILVGCNKRRFNNLSANKNDSSSRYTRYAVNIYWDWNKSLGLLPSGNNFNILDAWNSLWQYFDSRRSALALKWIASLVFFILIKFVISTNIHSEQLKNTCHVLSFLCCAA